MKCVKKSCLDCKALSILVVSVEFFRFVPGCGSGLLHKEIIVRPDFFIIQIFTTIKAVIATKLVPMILYGLLATVG